MLRLSDIEFAYPRSERVLCGASLEVAPGEHVVLLGSNGCGKSTLARLANGSIEPAAGVVEMDGEVSREGARRAFFEEVGYVQQDPRAQLVTSSVRDEVAFGPRNLRLEAAEVERRVGRALEACDLERLADRSVMELSGGQQQRLAFAGVLAMEPRYLVLDEVSAQLDSAARERVADLVRRVCAAGRGVLEITHLVEDVLRADRVLVMDAGRIAWEGSPDALLRDEEALSLSGLRGAGLDALAALARAGMDVAGADAAAMGRFADERGLGARLQALLGGEGREHGDEASEGLVVEDASFAYGHGASRHVALSHMRLAAPCGAVTLVVGASGSGKTTASLVAAGLLEAEGSPATLAGRVVRAGDVGLSLQRPDDQLFASSVLADVSFGPANRGLAAEEADRVARDALAELGVDEALFAKNPLALSGGQRRRVALAGICAMRAAAYVFDEPTAGLDGAGRELMRSVALRLARQGDAVVVVTHDADEWLHLSSRIAFVADGAVVREVDLEGARPTCADFEAVGLVAPLALRLGEVLHG